jgi:pSer/pThr/pTyr-binding forkhead associated (FHA) protein
MSGQLEIIKGLDVGRKFPLKEGAKLLLGRSRKTENPIGDRNVSRAHCEVKVEGDRVLLTDLNSHSGTFVNGQRIQEQAIRPGDVISIGSTQLRYLAPGEEGAAPNEAEPVVRTDTVIERPRKPVPTGTIVEPPTKPLRPTETIVEPPRKPAVPTETIVEPPRKPGLGAHKVPAGSGESPPLKKTDTVIEMHPPRVEGRDRGRLNPEGGAGLRPHWVWLLVGILLAFGAGLAVMWALK